MSEMLDVRPEDLKQYFLLPGDLYVQGNRPRPFLLQKIGQRPELSRLDAYLEQGIEVFTLDSMSKEATLKFLRKHLKTWKDCDHKADHVKMARGLVNYFEENLWNRPLHTYYDFAVSMLEAFGDFTTNKLNTYLDKCEELFYHSLCSAPIAVVAGITSGHFEFQILQDIYRACFLYNYTFMKAGPSYRIKDALIKEWNEPGRGINDLADFQKEQVHFLQRSTSSYERAYIDFAGQANNAFLLEGVRYDGELANGTGPHGMTELALPEWARCCLLGHMLAPHDTTWFQKDKFTAIKDLANNERRAALEKVPVQEILQRFEQRFGGIKGGLVERKIS